jgi:hypothetical protein
MIPDDEVLSITTAPLRAWSLTYWSLQVEALKATWKV